MEITGRRRYPVEAEIDALPYFEKGVHFFNIVGPNAETVEFCQIL